MLILVITLLFLSQKLLPKGNVIHDSEQIKVNLDFAEIIMSFCRMAGGPVRTIHVKPICGIQRKQIWRNKILFVIIAYF